MRRKADFECLLQRGARSSAEGYTFYLSRRQSGAARLGMLVSRKHAVRAVDRNRIKRCIREAFRLTQQNLGSVDLLVRPPFGVKASRDMVVRLQRLLGRLCF